jgi:hypothetical protein
VDIVTLASRHAEHVRVSENIKLGSSSWFELRKLIFEGIIFSSNVLEFDIFERCRNTGESLTVYTVRFQSF